MASTGFAFPAAGAPPAAPAAAKAPAAAVVGFGGFGAAAPAAPAASKGFGGFGAPAAAAAPAAAEAAPPAPAAAAKGFGFGAPAAAAAPAAPAAAPPAVKGFGAAPAATPPVFAAAPAPATTTAAPAPAPAAGGFGGFGAKTAAPAPAATAPTAAPAPAAGGFGGFGAAKPLAAAPAAPAAGGFGAAPGAAAKGVRFAPLPNGAASSSFLASGSSALNRLGVTSASAALSGAPYGPATAGGRPSNGLLGAAAADAGVGGGGFAASSAAASARRFNIDVMDESIAIGKAADAARLSLQQQQQRLLPNASADGGNNPFASGGSRSSAVARQQQRASAAMPSVPPRASLVAPSASGAVGVVTAPVAIAGTALVGGRTASSSSAFATGLPTRSSALAASFTAGTAIPSSSLAFIAGSNNGAAASQQAGGASAAASSSARSGASGAVRYLMTRDQSMRAVQIFGAPAMEHDAVVAMLTKVCGPIEVSHTVRPTVPLSNGGAAAAAAAVPSVPSLDSYRSLRLSTNASSHHDVTQQQQPRPLQWQKEALAASHYVASPDQPRSLNIIFATAEGAANALSLSGKLETNGRRLGAVLLSEVVGGEGFVGAGNSNGAIAAPPLFLFDYESDAAFRPATIGGLSGGAASSSPSASAVVIIGGGAAGGDDDEAYAGAVGSSSSPTDADAIPHPISILLSKGKALLGRLSGSRRPNRSDDETNGRESSQGATAGGDGSSPSKRHRKEQKPSSSASFGAPTPLPVTAVCRARFPFLMALPLAEYWLLPLLRVRPGADDANPFRPLPKNVTLLTAADRKRRAAGRSKY